MLPCCTVAPLSIKRPGLLRLAFSPLGSYLLTWERWQKPAAAPGAAAAAATSTPTKPTDDNEAEEEQDEEEEEASVPAAAATSSTAAAAAVPAPKANDNLLVWSLESGTVIASFQQKNLGVWYGASATCKIACIVADTPTRPGRRSNGAQMRRSLRVLAPTSCTSTPAHISALSCASFAYVPQRAVQLFSLSFSLSRCTLALTASRRLQASRSFRSPPAPRRIDFVLLSPRRRVRVDRCVWRSRAR